MDNNKIVFWNFQWEHKINFIGVVFIRNVLLKQPVVKIFFYCLEIRFNIIEFSSKILL